MRKRPRPAWLDAPPVSADVPHHGAYEDYVVRKYKPSPRYRVLLASLQQGVPPWTHLRLNYSTASENARGAGLDPRHSQWEAYRVLAGLADPWKFDAFTQYIMNRGHAMESGIVKIYNAMREDGLLPFAAERDPVRHEGMALDRDCPFFGASPDGLIGERGGLEIKCRSHKATKQMSHTSVPPEYMAQAQAMTRSRRSTGAESRSRACTALARTGRC
jgi:hypothetical protein